MTISKDKHRRYIPFPKDLEEKLEELAEKKDRSFNNLVIHVLSQYVEQADKVIDNNRPHS